jgi:hypothetical protein
MTNDHHSFESFKTVVPKRAKNEAFQMLVVLGSETTKINKLHGTVFFEQ